MRRTLLALPLTLALSCGDRAARVADDPAPSPSPTAAEALMLTCGRGTAFPPEALVGPADAERGTDEAAAALRAWVTSNDVQEVPATGWRLLANTGEVALYAHGPKHAHAVTFERKNGRWTWAGYAGSCEPRVQPPRGTGSAEWAPAGPVGPEQKAFVANVTERACASRQSPEGRIEPPRITYTDTTVVVTFFVRALGGTQTCPSNPSAPYEVTLREPLGTRTLLDGSTYPARPPSGGV